jgi:WD40 repeat protein
VSSSVINNQIHCEHCGFIFCFAGGEAQTSVICPACGEESLLTFCQKESKLRVVGDYTSDIDCCPPLPLHPASPDEILRCRSKNCPRISGSIGSSCCESGCGECRQTPSDVFKTPMSRRRKILGWAVAINICILIGTALFITRAVVETKVNVVGDIVKVPEPVQSVPVEVMSTSVVPEVAESAEKTGAETYKKPITLQDAFAEQIVADPYESSLYEPTAMPPELSQPDRLPLESQTAIQPLPAATQHEQTLHEPVAVQPVTTNREEAEKLLAEAQSKLETDPDASCKDLLRAAKILEQLGEPLPANLYWQLGQSFASVSWGKGFLSETPAVKSMSISSDSRWLLTQLQDQSVWLWDLQSDPQKKGGFRLDSGADYVQFVFTPDLRLIVGGQADGTIRVWDMTLPNPSESMITLKEKMHSLADLQISPDGYYLAALSKIQKPGNALTNQAAYQTARPSKAAASEQTAQVFLWDLRQIGSGTIPSAKTLPNALQPIQTMLFSPDSKRLAVGGMDALVRVYDLTEEGISGDPILLRGHQLSVTVLAFAPNSQWLATGSHDNTVRLWKLTSSRLAPESVTLLGHLGWISSIAVDSAGQYLYTGSYDKTVRIWKIDEGKIETALKTEPVIIDGNQGIIQKVLVSKSGEKLISLGGDGSLTIYRLPIESENAADNGADEAELRSLVFRNRELPITESLLTSDDEWLVFSYTNQQAPANSGIRLWSLKLQELLRLVGE